MMSFRISPRPVGLLTNCRSTVGWVLGLFLFLIFSGNASATDPPPVAKRPLAGFLTPAGTLQPGAAGAFDPTGYRLTTDPATGQPAFRPTGAGDDKWDERFGPATPLNGTVNAIAVAGKGDIVVGGNFVNAGGNPNADRIARWDGNSWQALGTGISNGTVKTVLVTANRDIVVGGSFADAGGNTAADGVARWDGSAWRALGIGVAGTALALAQTGIGTLVVGGQFGDASGTAGTACIAAWNGTGWQTIGNGLNNQVNALAIAPNGDLVVGGAFTDAGGNADADCLTRWDGTAWQAYGTGMLNNPATSSVSALAFNPAGLLYVGGTDLAPRGNGLSGFLHTWNGTTWGALGGGITAGTGTVSTILLNGNNVYIGGSFSLTIGSPTNNIAQFNGSNWQPAGFVAGAAVQQLALSAAGSVLVGGSFVDAGGNTASDYLTQLKPQAGNALVSVPLPLGQGLNGPVYAIYAFADGTAVVGGAFTDAGGNPNADRIARWNGRYWEALGTGISNGTVKCLDAVSPSEVVAGGTFTGAGGNTLADRVAYWDGSGWYELGGSSPNNRISNGSVEAVALAGNSIATGVYVGGSFTGVGNRSTGNYIVQMTRAACYSLDRGTDGTVYAIATNRTNALITVGGSFPSVNSNRNMKGIARYNGISWSSLGTGINGTVYDVDVAGTTGGSYVACGDFPGGLSGTSGTISGGIIYSLAQGPSGNSVAGDFQRAGAVSEANYAATFQTGSNNWISLGTGLDSVAYAVENMKLNGTIVGAFFGGGFKGVGDGSKKTTNFGIYYNVFPNNAPVIGAQTFTINENAANGTVVGTVAASDPDARQTLTYAITAGGGAFRLVGNQIVVANSALLVYQTTPTFTLTVRVTDNGTPEVKVNAAQITINLRDITPPTLTLSTIASNPTIVSPIPVTAAFSESVTGFTASDVAVTNGTVGSFSGSGASYSFSITPTMTGPVTAAIAANIAQDAAGNGNAAAALFSISYTGPTATGVAAPITSLTLYPNPANETVTISGAYAAEVLVLNCLGQVVRQQRLVAGAAELATGSLAAGVYYVQVANHAQRKLVVFH